MLRYYLSPLDEGMYLSNEPGYYKDGSFGIRIESDLLIVPASFRGGSEGEGARKWLKFEYVTMVPMCIELIDTSILSAEERDWIGEYHAQVLRELEPRLVAAISQEGAEEGGSTSAADTLAWLRRAARPVGE
jgi:Xaa-Pro aminopeptidase